MFETVEDLLPEHVRYRDQGCDLFPSCLECPLPRCRHDWPERRQVAKELRNEEVVRLHREGETITELAGRYRVSTRTIYRIVRRSDGRPEHAAADRTNG
jgi:DNA invertase Pin-like site-specific DNA recombinase